MMPTAVKAVRVRPRASAAPPKAATQNVDPSVGFAEYVRARLDGPVLRYSQRQALLKEAERRGVGRFEANLVIAKVLYQAGWRQEYELAPEPRRTWAAPVMTFVILQSAIFVGAWWVLG
jgi:hypothetical protein